METKTIIRSYKYRIYPTKTQIIKINKNFGCCRFVYNKCLEYRIQMYLTDQNSGYYDTNNYCNRILKNKYTFLKEADSRAINHAVINLNEAFIKYFRKETNFPKFKKKKNNYQSYTTSNSFQKIKNGTIIQSISANFSEKTSKLPKIGYVKTKFYRSFSGKIKNAIIVYSRTKKYYVIFQVEEEYIPWPHTNNSIGIDVGLKKLATDSNGTIYDNLKVYHKYEKRIIKLTKELHRKCYKSNNWNKNRIKLAKIYEKIVNIRKDYYQKISSKIVYDNQIICLENLNIENFLRNNNLSKAFGDASIGALRKMIIRKSEWNNRTIVFCPTSFPSSQLCSVCGYKNPLVKDLSVRFWECPFCHSIHDRDINAAINIKNKGLEIFNSMNNLSITTFNCIK